MSKALAALRDMRKHRDDLLDDATGWTVRALTHRPRVDAWSALEMIDHLRRTEQWVAREIHMSAQNQRRNAARTTPAQIILFTIMRSPLRVKVPKGSEELHPSSPGTLSVVANNWIAAGEQLELAISKLKEQEAQLAVVRHPVGGWMNATTAARFLEVHLRHHLHQWERLKAASAYAC